jgi:hypothetical protein
VDQPAADSNLLLELVAESEGRWDTRTLDVLFYERGGTEGPTVLSRLAELEAGGYIRRLDIEGGTGPAFKLTEAGAEMLARRGGPPGR